MAVKILSLGFVVPLEHRNRAEGVVADANRLPAIRKPEHIPGGIEVVCVNPRLYPSEALRFQTLCQALPNVRQVTSHEKFLEVLEQFGVIQTVDPRYARAKDIPNPLQSHPDRPEPQARAVDHDMVLVRRHPKQSKPIRLPAQPVAVALAPLPAPQAESGPAPEREPMVSNQPLAKIQGLPRHSSRLSVFVQDHLTEKLIAAGLDQIAEELFPQARKEGFVKSRWPVREAARVLLVEAGLLEPGPCQKSPGKGYEDSELNRLRDQCDRRLGEIERLKASLLSRVVMVAQLEAQVQVLEEELRRKDVELNLLRKQMDEPED